MLTFSFFFFTLLSFFQFLLIMIICFHREPENGSHACLIRVTESSLHFYMGRRALDYLLPVFLNIVL